MYKKRRWTINYMPQSILTLDILPANQHMATHLLRTSSAKGLRWWWSKGQTDCSGHTHSTARAAIQLWSQSRERAEKHGRNVRSFLHGHHVQIVLKAKGTLGSTHLNPITSKMRRLQLKEKLTDPPSGENEPVTLESQHRRLFIESRRLTDFPEIQVCWVRSEVPSKALLYVNVSHPRR